MKTLRESLWDPRRAKHAFSPPLSLGKKERMAIALTMLIITALDMNFPLP
jgi:hypothetical protein